MTRNNGREFVLKNHELLDSYFIVMNLTITIIRVLIFLLKATNFPTHHACHDDRLEAVFKV
jgi:hypothetical protein